MKLLVAGRYKRVDVEKWLKEKGCTGVARLGEVMPGHYQWYSYSRNSVYYQLIWKVKSPHELYIFECESGDLFSPHVFYYYLQTGEVVNVSEDYENADLLERLEYGSHIELKKPTE